MVEALKFAALLPKVAAMDARALTAERAVEMATLDGARALGLEAAVGSLEVGKRADLFLADFRTAHASPVHNPASALVYAATGPEVRTVLVDGRVVLRDARLPHLDERAIVARAQQAAEALVARAGIGHLRARPWRSTA
jgi:5-methylthioadenosine/S-adenosylhomocysteine deaminase